MSKKNGKTIICKICGIEKYYPGYRFHEKDRGIPQYCSRACKYEGMKKQLRIICPCCKNEFLVLYKNRRNKYCSLSCSREARKTGRKIKCETCGTEKYYPPSCFTKTRTPKFCSKKCKIIGLIGHVPWNKGKKTNLEWRLRCSNQISGERHPRWGKSCSKETKEKISNANKGKKRSEEVKKAIGKANKKHWECPEYRGRMEKINLGRVPWNKGKKLSEEHKRKLSESHKGNKNSPSWFKKMCGRKLSSEHIKKAMRRRIPTSLKERFMEIAYKHNLPYAYVGAGSLVIENFNPDFVNVGNEKILVEVYARIYKTLDGKSIETWKNTRTDTFLRHGWNTIFFDEIELTEENVLLALS